METVTASYGRCFTFNSIYNNKDDYAPRVASLTGVANGMTIALYANEANYMKNGLSSKAGSRLIIHPVNLAPQPDEEGLDLHPGQASSVPTTVNSYTRLPTPFKPNCTSAWNDTKMETSEKIEYSLASCQRVCLQQAIIEECGCFHPNIHQQALLTEQQEADLPRVCFIAPTWSSKSALTYKIM